MIERIKSLNLLVLLLIFTGISLLLSLILEESIYFFEGNRSVFEIYDAEDSLQLMLIESVIIAPIIESLLMSTVLEMLFVFLRKSRYKYIISIIICGALFGIMHFYNIYYIMVTSVIGFLYSSIYVFFRKTRLSYKYAILGIILVHALDNLITILLL